jgi:hypothetical protein
MDRKKYLKTPNPFGGLMPPYHQNGKALMVYDAPGAIDHTSFLLKTALTDCASDNPFQILGVDESIIFSVQDGIGSTVMDAITTLLDEFKDRLKTNRLEVTEDQEEGVDTLTYEGEYLPFKETVSALLPLSSME